MMKEWRFKINNSSFIILHSSFILAFYGAVLTVIRICLLPTLIFKGLPSWMGCVSPLISIWSGGIAGTLVDASGVAGVGALSTSLVRITRLVATMRQETGAHTSRMPGISVSTASVGASASTLKSPSPQRTPAPS